MTTPTNERREYWTTDRRFGVVIPQSAIEEILNHSVESNGLETGGIAMGRYSDCHTYAAVDHFTGPPADSKHGRFTFVRGVKGLQAIIAKLWTKERRYYLGEWHFHPGASAEPSGTDRSQMVAIASDAKYACPEPLLFILGGDPNGAWELRVFLTLSDRKQVELFRT